MSEPMSSGEIEDVLSSIRRLVSEDLRQSSRPAFPAPQAEPPAVAPEPPPERPARLLLTPALRVVDPVPEPVAEPEQPAAEIEVEVAPEPEAVGEPPAPAGPPTLILHRNDDPGPDDHTEAWPGEDEEDDPEPAADRVARIGAGMARTDAWEAEAGDAPPTVPVTRLSWIDVADSHDEAEVQAMRFVHRAPAADPVVPPEPSPLIGTTSDDVLDEALLRDIVREVLREELQGHLGERITRNIRKLVRAEVHRALTLKDWD